jgi:hypothetical protein
VSIVIWLCGDKRGVVWWKQPTTEGKEKTKRERDEKKNTPNAIAKAAHISLISSTMSSLAWGSVASSFQK